ncbi:MAG: hypothetical protein K9N47_07935 [Prosthecobacter sp.]|uniref:hypothetical protein n=1 Tax=Prosthecobacter sp. TaxID=1965333 RepID=UPI0026013027|nr:hypothetical protein [Prosthecobacter sp.]MCF7786036.1 hypothetical protein [Prosthecobacter sp.]
MAALGPLMLGWMLDDVCVYIGSVVLWLWRRRRYDLPDEWKRLRELDMRAVWRWKDGKGREALTGLVTLVVTGALIWAYRRWA